MNRRYFLTRSGCFAVLALGGAHIFVPGKVYAGDMRVFTGKTEGVAINGYDTVAYHTMGKPVLGSKDHMASWNGVAWHFSSEENRKLFEAEPEKYAPQYGGFCAFGAAKNSASKSEPDAFSIVGEKLYLNYNQGIRARWNEGKDDFIKAADKNWPGLSKQ